MRIVNIPFIVCLMCRIGRIIHLCIQRGGQERLYVMYRIIEIGKRGRISLIRELTRVAARRLGSSAEAGTVFHRIRHEERRRQ